MSRNLYKKKGLGDVDSKSKRLLRRSIHQKDVRDQGFLNRRAVDDELSPLKDVSLCKPEPEADLTLHQSKLPAPKITRKTAAPPPPKGLKKKTDVRREMLNKWREEKEMKRKIEQIEKESRRPNFKVHHLEHEKTSFLTKANASKKKLAKNETGQAVPVVRRSSRLATKEPPPTSTKRTRQQKPAVTKAPPSKPNPTKSTRTFTPGVKSNRVPPAPAVKKPTKRAAPKIKEAAFPTAKSFTFKKEVSTAPSKNYHGPVKRGNTSSSLKPINGSSLNPTKRAPSARAALSEGRVTRQTAVKARGATSPKRRPSTRNQASRPAPDPKQALTNRAGAKKTGPSTGAGARSGRIPHQAPPASRATAREGNSVTRKNSSKTASATRARSSSRSSRKQEDVEQAADMKEELQEVFTKEEDGQKLSLNSEANAVDGPPEEETKTTVKNAGKLCDESAIVESVNALKEQQSMDVDPVQEKEIPKDVQQTSSPSIDEASAMDVEESKEEPLSLGAVPVSATTDLVPQVGQSSEVTHSGHEEIVQPTVQSTGVLSHQPESAAHPVTDVEDGAMAVQQQKPGKIGMEITPLWNEELPFVYDSPVSPPQADGQQHAPNSAASGKKDAKEDTTSPLMLQMSDVDMEQPAGQLTGSVDEKPEKLDSVPDEMPEGGDGNGPTGVEQVSQETAAVAGRVVEDASSISGTEPEEIGQGSGDHVVDEGPGSTEDGCDGVVVSEEDRAGADSFQSVMDKERERMAGLCSSWETVMTAGDIPDDACGDIRSAIGKAQLLMNQRFGQFSGLIEQCRLGLGVKRTHTTDLQGFWDMIYFQIEDVNKMFSKLDELKANGWTRVEEVKPQPKPKQGKKKRAPKKKPTGDSQAARERLAAFKAAMKKAQPGEPVVLDPAIFRRKSTSPHCGGSPKKPLIKSRPTTPTRSAKRPSLGPREQQLLRAVLQASNTPRLSRSPAPRDNSDTPSMGASSSTMSPLARSIFTPEKSPAVASTAHLLMPNSNIFTPEKSASPAGLSPKTADGLTETGPSAIAMQETMSGITTPGNTLLPAVTSPNARSIFTPEESSNPSTSLLESSMTEDGPLKPKRMSFGLDDQAPSPQGTMSFLSPNAKSIFTPEKMDSSVTVPSMVGTGIFSPVNPAPATEGEDLANFASPLTASNRKRSCSQMDKSQESDSGKNVETTPEADSGQNGLDLQYLMATTTGDDDDLEEAPEQPEAVIDTEQVSTGPDTKYFTSALSCTEVISPLPPATPTSVSCTPSKLAKVEPSETIVPKMEPDVKGAGETTKAAAGSVASAADVEGAVHYAGVMSKERERLTSSCSSWTQFMESEPVSEEVCGDIRSAIGKAQLLMNQRFNQFEGLLEQCRLGLGEKRTHTTDLQGFWEMVHYQVEDVDGMFEELSERKENGWVPKEEDQKPVVKKILKKKVKSKAKGKAADRTAARERLAAAKAAMAKKQTRQDENVVFDGGFFKVESPVRMMETDCMKGGDLGSSPCWARTRASGTPASRKSMTPHKTPERTPLADKERSLLRAVLKASNSPQMMLSPTPAGSVFSPVRVTPVTESDVVTRLRDLGLSSGRASSARKRRCSQRNRKDAARTENLEKENECGPAKHRIITETTAGDHNAAMTNLLKKEPVDDLRGLATRTPLGDRKDKQNGADVSGPPLTKPGLQDDILGSPAYTPRRSLRSKPGRVSAFSPPRRSFANIPPSTDLISFD